MQKKRNNRSDVGRRAWNILRLALLWARKGGVFKRRLMLDLPNYLKSLRYTVSGNDKGASLHYGERQLSFDDSPIIHVKMHRPSSLRFRLPHIPCINPHVVDFGYDFSDDHYDNDDRLFQYINGDGGARKSFLKDVEDDDCGSETSSVGCDEEIDRKAEEFIANFYQQIRLQRQISYLEYNQ